MAEASDAGEPGAGRDAFTITVRDADGGVVATVAGTIASGNIQSTRLGRPDGDRDDRPNGDKDEKDGKDDRDGRRDR